MSAWDFLDKHAEGLAGLFILVVFWAPDILKAWRGRQ
jgi:hypothetical protein